MNTTMYKLLYIITSDSNEKAVMTRVALYLVGFTFFGTFSETSASVLGAMAKASIEGGSGNVDDFIAKGNSSF
ncbi:hypothetical protein ACIQXF_13120 [Lysinibacillus sp. NPDC097231]|uniref:hypothetical protein n=1 Tax=Lysinibacillus sp. NPDC097231 TaxID=3364142 RepID=UPI0037F661FB